MFRRAIFAVITLLAALDAAPAQARIACRAGFQSVGGSQIATPYCQDLYVAQVARTYGVKVSDQTIRNNPNVKREVCRLIGQDNRVFIACGDANSSSRRGF